MFNLIEYRITFGVDQDRHGSKLFDGDPTQFSLALQEVCESAAIEFGGYTMIDGRGGWFGPDGVLVEESCRTLIVCVQDDPAASLEDDVIELAHNVGRALNQHSVVVSRGDRSAIIEVKH